MSRWILLLALAGWQVLVQPDGKIVCARLAASTRIFSDRFEQP